MCSATTSTTGRSKLDLAGQTVGRVVGPADVVALAVHPMINTALTGATSTSTAGNSSCSENG
jgi:hypothetical protein